MHVPPTPKPYVAGFGYIWSDTYRDKGKNIRGKDYSKDWHKAEYMGPGFTESAAGQ